MDDLTTTQGIAALAAGGVALLALIFALVLGVKLRRLRQAQSAVLGDYGSRDLVAHAERLEHGFTQLRDWVEESMQTVESRMGHRSEEHTSELQSRQYLVCRLLLEKKKNK